eukprot:NODE_5675_length_920_cov_112.237139_g5452_i0.p1 GENE.NODE_5675_length_920_cov_112.237139_g5452_i0~~NODE_5675_length_920_cov_112.237139_g5452_i0.p1  ORF type:complete len:237 (-),score=31.71 NODE_5675_length_920_cov_112.237139_g5452_i0:209-847(-)
MATNEKLLVHLRRTGMLHSSEVESAMRAVDRANYMPGISKPYDDNPQYIGYGVTISAPHMHAFALEGLKDYLKPGMRALDVGSGSGYLTACMAQMCGTCHGIEYIPDLVPISLENAQRDGKGAMLESGNMTLQHGDGSKGLAEHAPFNAIHVGAAAPRLPQALLDQLASPGRLIIPVGQQHENQYMMTIDKDASGRITQSRGLCVRYVPLHM